MFKVLIYASLAVDAIDEVFYVFEETRLGVAMHKRYHRFDQLTEEPETEMFGYRYR